MVRMAPKVPFLILIPVSYEEQPDSSFVFPSFRVPCLLVGHALLLRAGNSIQRCPFLILSYL